MVRTILVICFFLLDSYMMVAAVASPLQKNLSHKLIQLEKSKGIVASVFAKSVDTKETIFAHQENHALIPASNMKIITTAAALNTLGSQFTFKTEIYHTGTIKNKVFNV